jgi:hypothetical protein
VSATGTAATAGPGNRTRWLILGLVVLLVAALSAFYVVKAAKQQSEAAKPTAATAKDTALPLGSVLNAPHIVFRSTAPGPTFGHLAAVPLADPGGGRSSSSLTCNRVYATQERGICLRVIGSGLSNYRDDVLNAQMQPVGQLNSAGDPSRARISKNQQLVATTVFVSGHSYASFAFSTETDVRNVVTGVNYGNLETSFTYQIAPRLDHAVDLNVWGVTFDPDNANYFYATVAAGGHTYLGFGNFTTRTLTAIGTDAECPSISPDGRTIVYKKRVNGSAIKWHFYAYDVATGRETPLPESRSVDDQVEWLDDSHVLYGVPRGNNGVYDVWESDIHGTAKPHVFMTDAESPAVVR